MTLMGSWFRAVLILAGCVESTACLTTKHNPASCANGLCTDPSLPFCDVDGSVAGQANTCIAVACEPQDIAGCRGDAVIRCNDTGNNFDLVACENGCDPTKGCLSCSDDHQCGNPNPVCDLTSHECRACSGDDECSSAVCDSGSCVPESSVVYASPNGIGIACTQTSPCDISNALLLATNAAHTPVLRLLPGTYVGGVQVTTPTIEPLHVVATGATLGGTRSVSVESGATVSLRNAILASPFSCGKATGSASMLALRDVQSIPPSNSAGSTIANCSLDIVRADFDLPSSWRIDPGAVVTADRVRFHARDPNSGSSLTFGLGQAHLRIIDSVMENILIDINSADSAQAEVAFSTVVLTGSEMMINCKDFGHVWTATYEDDVIVAPNSPPALGGGAFTQLSANCVIRHNVLFPQPTPIPNNVTADPQFVNMAGRDFHLRSTSPARDAAVPSAPLTSDHDFEGVARPQGTQPDIGAFELKP